MKKDVEWLKNEVNELPLRFLGFSVLKQREEFTVSKDDVLELINQLDEPEDLAQDLPVIPQFVADWLDDNIERYKTVYSFIISLVEVFGDTVPEKVWTYASKNPDTMARAYLDGYTVEEEQKYYVKIMDKYLTDKGLGIGITFDVLYTSGKKMGYQQQFTEQEIKDYDERYFAFAVKVEEMEE